MHSPLSATLFTITVLISQTSAAATVFRCTDATGRITYTQQGCPGDTNIQKQQAYNPTPGSGKAVRMASTNPTRNPHKASPPSPTSSPSLPNGTMAAATASAAESAATRSSNSGYLAG